MSKKSCILKWLLSSTPAITSFVYVGVSCSREVREWIKSYGGKANSQEVVNSGEDRSSNPTNGSDASVDIIFTPPQGDREDWWSCRRERIYIWSDGVSEYCNVKLDRASSRVREMWDTGRSYFFRDS